MTQNMNLALGVNFDLLKTNLAAMYEKDSTGSKILLLPTTVNSPNPVTLDEMLADFKNAFGMNEEDSKKIGESLNGVKKEGSKFDVNKITFQLQAAFLYKNTPAIAAPENGGSTPDTPEGESGTAGTADDTSTTSATSGEEVATTTPANAEKGFTEYAFAVSVNMADALPNFGFIKLNSLFVAVWNTERENVLKQIGAGNITRMLQQLEA